MYRSKGRGWAQEACGLGLRFDADSKMILSYLCGGRDASWACKFMDDLAQV
jgi:hypothetical protein